MFWSFVSVTAPAYSVSAPAYFPSGPLTSESPKKRYAICRTGCRNHQKITDDGRYHNICVSEDYQPLVCHEVAYRISTGSYASASVDEHDPADRLTSLISSSNRAMDVSRKFKPCVF